MPWPQCRFQSFVMHLPQSLVSRPQCHGPSATWPQCHLASVGPSAIAPFESEGHVYHVRGKQTKGSGHRVEPCLHTTLRCWQSYLQHDGRWQMASSRIVTAILGGDCPEARPPSWRRPFACFPGPTPQWRMDLQPTAELADGLPEIVIDQAPVGSQPDWCCPSRHSHDFFCLRRVWMDIWCQKQAQNFQCLKLSYEACKGGAPSALSGSFLVRNFGVFWSCATYNWV